MAARLKQMVLIHVFKINFGLYIKTNGISIKMYNCQKTALHGFGKPTINQKLK
jgi:hypothetical protein